MAGGVARMPYFHHVDQHSRKYVQYLSFLQSNSDIFSRKMQNNYKFPVIHPTTQLLLLQFGRFDDEDPAKVDTDRSR